MTQSKAVQGRRWAFADCEYFERGRRLLVAGQPVRVEAKPLDVLQLFLERPAEVLTKDQLLGEAWDIATSDQSLAVAISKLRRAFGGSRERILLSLPGIGYRMAVPVTCAEDSTPLPPEFLLSPGDPIPSRDQWTAVRPLDFSLPHLVWVAEHRKTHEARVFKFATDGIRLRALQREVSLSRLFAAKFPDSSHFLRITDWSFDQSPFFTEAPFGGMNLFEFGETPEFSAMCADERAVLVAQIAAAVADAHSIGVLHNDLKPSNILVFPRGPASASDIAGASTTERWQVRVVDFGIASLSDLGLLQALEITDHGEFLAEPAHNSPRSPRGSPLYAAPELRRDGAQPDTRADVYALGVILFQVLSGDFSAPVAPGWQKHVLDPLLRTDIENACNLDPDLRTSSAAAFATNLKRLPDRRGKAEREEQDARRRLHDEQELMRARARRPWVAATIAALVLGILGTSWFFYRAAQQRNQAIARSQTLAAMNRFLVEDLLTQADPTASPHAAPAAQETLLDAIRRAQPRIDSRFSHSPEVAAAIHETLGNAFGALSSYREAHGEYRAAAQRFKQAQGPLSQAALQAELRDIVLLYIEQTPQTFAQARSSLQALQPALARVATPAPELQGWEVMATTADILSSDRPADTAVPLLKRAIAQAQQTPGYNPALLSAMELRLCGVYLKADRGEDTTVVAQASIDRIRKQDGPDSSGLFVPETYLEEGLFEQNRFREAELRSGQDYQQFLRLLGPDSRFTLSALDMHAQAEGALHEYPQAIQDWLKLYDVTATNPSAQFFSQTAIVEAGQLECHTGAYPQGEQHLQQGLAEISSHGGVKALNYSVGSLALAECMLAQAEDRHTALKSAEIVQVQHLISSFDWTTVRSFAGTESAQGNLLLARARLAYQQREFASARQLAVHARALVEQPSADTWEQGRLATLEAQLRNVTPAEQVARSTSAGPETVRER